ncbi:hypothetical protein [Aureliella helgolandensis]|uniref:hypothetical protein n=1 Tax=Aureliella helgolandensis TaxID=2527968 RepID=UPI0011A55A49|nr:hypothetical protein [Aureliella helgolandensis]
MNQRPATPNGNRSLPNLYQLLSLPALESDAVRIEQAIARVEAEAVQPTDAQGSPQAKHRSERLRRIAALGRKYLLNSQQKLAYDQQWKAVFRKPQVHAQLVETAADSPASSGSRGPVPRGAVTEKSLAHCDPLLALLPDASPTDAFNMSSFLEHSSSGISPMTRDEDFEQLLQLLKTAPPSTERPDSVQPMQPLEQQRNADGHEEDQSPEPLAADAPTASPGKFEIGSAKAPRATSMKETQKLAKKLRSKRQNSMVWLLGGVLTGVGILLGIMFLVQQRFATPPAIAQNAPQTPLPPPPEPPRGSGLPQVSGLTNEVLTPTEPLEAGPQAVAPATMEPSIAPTPSVTSTPPTPMEDTFTAPVPVEMPATNPSMANTPPMANSTGAPLSDQEKVQWKTRLQGIRQSIQTRDYTVATEELTQAGAQAQSQEQKEQLKRLTELNNLAQAAHTALVEAITTMGGAETLQIGSSTVISFVEGDADHIVIRLRGERKEYSTETIPIALVYAFQDLKLDIQNPISNAQKAAYTLTQSSTNGRMAEQAMGMLNRAIAAGAVAPDIAEALEENYDLP